MISAVKKIQLANLSRKNTVVRKVLTTIKRSRKTPGLAETFSKFVPEEQRKNTAYMKRLEKSLVEDCFVYMISPAEYFLFDFANLTDAQKHEFVGDKEKKLMCQALRGNDWRTLWDKNACYEKFQKFYKRDAVAVKSEEDKDVLFGFIARHGAAIIKEARGSLGKGVRIVHNTPAELDACWESIRNTFSENMTYIAEELIVQSEETAQFHPASVNSVRVMTFRLGNEVRFLGSFLRMGCGNSIVDNAGAGGVFAEIDMESGIVIGSGITETGVKYDAHPDTGVPIRGFQLPRWNELLDMCREMAMVLEDQYYTGWDLALTDKGWVMVEGNSEAQMVNQYPNHRGMRKIIRETFYEAIARKK